MSGRSTRIIVAVVLVVVLGVAWFVVDQRDDVPAPLANSGNVELVALGRNVYTESCASCHGAFLKGEADWQVRKSDGRLPAPPHDETGHTWHHDEQTLFVLTKYGPSKLIGGAYESDMPAFDGILTDEEIWAVLAFIKSTWPTEIQDRWEQINMRAQQQSR